jgi:hypothetical protein
LNFVIQKTNHNHLKDNMSAQRRKIMQIRLEINFYREVMTVIKKNKDEIHPCFPNLTKLISMKKLCYQIYDTKVVQ